MPTTATRQPGQGSGRGLWWLIVGQLLAGIGIASGIAVGGLLATQVAGTDSAAGSAQTATILGAGLLALPLAALAARRGRRPGLALGFALGALGAVVIVVATLWSQLWLLLLGMALFGSASAAVLQSRYAASELARPGRRASAMSIVLWSTTLGSVVGPNLAQWSSDLGEGVGIASPGGPYLISAAAFALAATAMLIGLPAAPPIEAPTARPRGGSWHALISALRHPVSRLGIVAVIAGQAMMVAVMVMTPVHMDHQGMSLTLVGIVISLHILGMYAASPLFGILTDRLGARTTIGLGMILLGSAFVLGATAPDHAHHHSELSLPWQLIIALGLLGLGWSACLIGGSSLVTASTSGPDGVRLQGAVDSAMNLIAAITAAVSGPILAWSGYVGVNLLGGAVLIGLLLAWAFSRRPIPTESSTL